MAARKSFLLRVDPAVLDAMRRWADDELRSLNGQIEFVLRQSLRTADRLPSGRVRRDPKLENGERSSQT